MKTTNEQFNILENYILKCIDFENYGKNPDSKEEKINLLIETFKDEYWHEYNKNHYNHDIKKGFSSWLSGLPSCFNVDFENYRILELGKLWMFDLSTENKEDRFLENWFSMVTNSVFYLYNRKDFRKVRSEQKKLSTI